MSNTFDPGFFALLEEAKIEVGVAEGERKFRKWLIAEDVMTVETSVGMACTDDLVASKIMAFLPSGIKYGGIHTTWHQHTRTMRCAPLEMIIRTRLWFIDIVWGGSESFYF